MSPPFITSARSQICEYPDGEGRGASAGRALCLGPLQDRCEAASSAVELTLLALINNTKAKHPVKARIALEGSPSSCELLPPAFEGVSAVTDFTSLLLYSLGLQPCVPLGGRAGGREGSTLVGSTPAGSATLERRQ